MEAHYSPEVLAGIRKARLETSARKNRLRVLAAGQEYSVLKIGEDGFTVSAETAPHLRGLVDLYDGGRHLLQCLIIRSEADSDLIHYEFKRRTQARETPPRDFAERDDAPAGLLENRR